MKPQLKQQIIKKIPAFTLMELLVALGILGFLTFMAVPIVKPMIYKAKSTEAQLQLEYLHTLEKNYFYIHSKYSNSFSDISYEQAKLVTADGAANYKIEITDASASSFKATATAVVDFDGNGVFNVWQVDQDKSIKEITPE